MLGTLNSGTRLRGSFRRNHIHLSHSEFGEFNPFVQTFFYEVSCVRPEGASCRQPLP